MTAGDLLAPAAAALAAVLGWTVARRTADATVSAAWRELLQPLRDELVILRGEVDRLGRENAVLTAQREADRQELGILRRLERAAALRSTADAAVLKTRLADAGFPVPDVSVDPPPLERTRATDHDVTGSTLGA